MPTPHHTDCATIFTATKAQQKTQAVCSVTYLHTYSVIRRRRFGGFSCSLLRTNPNLGMAIRGASSPLLSRRLHPPPRLHHYSTSRALLSPTELSRPQSMRAGIFPPLRTHARIYFTAAATDLIYIRSVTLFSPAP